MNKDVYKYLLNTYGRNPGQWIGFSAELTRTLLMQVYVAIVVSQVTIDIASGNFDTARRHTLYFFIAFISGATIGTLGELISTRAENLQYGRLMRSFYQKLIGKDVSFYRDHQTGYLASIFRQHLDSVITLIRFLRGDALSTFIALTIPPIVLFFASPGVGLVALCIVILQFIYVAWSSTKADPYREVAHEVYRRITGEVSDVVTNIIAFKAAGVEHHAYDRMSNLADQETAAFNARRRAGALLDLPRSIITACGMTAAIYVIIYNAVGVDSDSLGLIVLTLTYMFQMIRSVGALPTLIMQHDDVITKIYPTLAYLGTAYETIHDVAHPASLRITHGAIDIHRIYFSYASRSHQNKKIPVFQDLSIHITGGERVGIVGLSGAGKSTLANLLLRFDEIDKGSIKIDGVDIRQVQQQELRKNIAYVPQEPLLFHRTIRENITYYNDHYNDSEMISAATAAHAHEFIARLPDGYDTIVGERGIKLSGGQKQRIAIARAILKKAPIMIFDEATSALDSESERIIQRALPDIIGKQTAIVVAHRLSTVAGLDRIIVMHEGAIVESGTHEELLALKGRYYSLWQKQTSEFATDSRPHEMQRGA